MVLRIPVRPLEQLHRERGISLVEALVAIGLLFIIAAGILPLFSRAITNNASGNDATRMTNFTKQTGELALGSAFDSPDILVPAGADELVRVEQWVADTLASDTVERPASEGQWFLLGSVPADRRFPAQWQRTITVKQFGIDQWRPDQGFHGMDGYDGAVSYEFVQLKEVHIEVERFSLLAQRPTIVRVVKAF